MPKFIAQTITILGGVLIGLGIGAVLGEITKWQAYFYWLFLCITLILGGFLLAYGMMEKRRNKDEENKKKDNEESETNSSIDSEQDI